jgi:hypothetical protein
LLAVDRSRFCEAQESAWSDRAWEKGVRKGEAFLPPLSVSRNLWLLVIIRRLGQNSNRTATLLNATLAGRNADWLIDLRLFPAAGRPASRSADVLLRRRRRRRRRTRALHASPEESERARGGEQRHRFTIHQVVGWCSIPSRVSWPGRHICNAMQCNSTGRGVAATDVNSPIIASGFSGCLDTKTSRRMHRRRRLAGVWNGSKVSGSCSSCDGEAH